MKRNMAIRLLSEWSSPYWNGSVLETWTDRLRNGYCAQRRQAMDSLPSTCKLPAMMAWKV
jgi:hypothetical protein